MGKVLKFEKPESEYNTVYAVEIFHHVSIQEILTIFFKHYNDIDKSKRLCPYGSLENPSGEISLGFIHYESICETDRLEFGRILYNEENSSTIKIESRKKIDGIPHTIETEKEIKETTADVAYIFEKAISDSKFLHKIIKCPCDWEYLKSNSRNKTLDGKLLQFPSKK